MVRLQAADVSVVDHDTKPSRLADLVDVRRDAVLIRLGQVMRQQQDSLGTETLGLLGVLNRHAGRTAGAGEDRDEAVACVDGGLDDRGIFTCFEREEFPSAARGK
jgi:hypothetical protein